MAAGAAQPEAASFGAARVLIVYEWLYTWGGAERCLDELATLFPHADIVAGTVTPGARARFAVARRVRETWLRLVPGSRRYHRWFLPLQAAAFATVDTRGYDLVLSLSHSMGKLVRASSGGVHVCYCFSPPRYLWDLEQTYDVHGSLAQRVGLRVGAAPLRAIDRHGAAGVDHFIGISQCVRGRIQRAYGRESSVVYPPVAAKGSTSRTHGGFLLTLGRLVPYKRVDLAIQAAAALGIPLVVAGDGPERARLQRMAGPTTTFLGHVDESTAAELMASCSAFLFCAEEDFGIAPVEANAHGAPVVAFGGGAARETIVDGVSGLFFDEQTVGALIDAVNRCGRRRWDTDAITASAARFSPERFREGMVAQITQALVKG